MEWYWALALLLGLLVLLMMLGLPVAFAFLGLNIVGAIVFLGGEAGLVQLVRNVADATVKFSLVPIPLFVLMGEVLFHSGVAVRAVDAVDRLITRVPGRLSLVAIVGGTVFSALSGSTMANAALLGSVLMPEMRRRGYSHTMAMGPIMAVGGIAMLIPPSALAVLLGSLAGISIADLLIAGIVPGVLLAAVFFVYVVTRCWLDPSLAPVYAMERLGLRQRLVPFLVYVVPLLGLFVVVVGSILAGLATPSESAALGALGSVVAAAAYRSLRWPTLRRALVETAKVTVMILLVIAASLTFSQILAFSGATEGLLDVIRRMELTPLAIVVAMVVVLLFLGMFMDQLSMMLITVPFFFPLVRLFGLDPIWFGTIMLVALEVGLLTPPFGLLLFTMKGVAPPEVTMGQVYAAALPFVVLDLMIIAALILLPGLATWLPAQIAVD